MNIHEMENIVEEEMKQQSQDVLEMRYLNTDNTVFAKTEGGFVSLDYDGKHYNRVGVFHSFPFTSPSDYISIRESDEKQKEIGIIRNLDEDCSTETAELLREQLHIRYFIPKIKKIISIKDEYGYAYFHVKTDFGTCKFVIQMNSGGIVTLTETKILITDLDGNRFEIPDLTKLTGKELKKLDLFI